MEDKITAQVAVSPCHRAFLMQTELVFVRVGGEQGCWGGTFVRAANLASGPVKLECLRSSGGQRDRKTSGINI